MPTALQLEDGTFTASVSYVANSFKSTLNFQVTPRISATFRYTASKNIRGGPNRDPISVLYDRSFDLRYQLANEGQYRPAVTIGLQDFAGTGRFSGEYIVATKTVKPNLKASAGIGWGRLAERGAFSNPLGRLSDSFYTRPGRGEAGNNNGRPQVGLWFRGPAAVFAGIEWAASDRLRLKAEYSTDAYSNELANNPGYVKIKSPLNFSAEYRLRRGATLSAHVIGGSEIGFRFSTDLHPNKPAVTGREEAPFPIRNRRENFAQQHKLFGDVIDGADLQTHYILNVPRPEIKQSPSGVRIAHVKSACNPTVAKEIDAQQGVVDLVIFENKAGVADCSVILRPAGRTYVEAVSARQPMLSHGTAPSPSKVDAIVQRLQSLVESDGIAIESSDITDYRAEVRIRSSRFDASAQAVGRMARAMTHVLPNTVEEFNIVLMAQGLPVTSVVLRRSDLEELEHHGDGAWKAFARAQISASEPLSDRSLTVPGFYPKLTGSLRPAIEANFFDPDNPFRFDLKARGIVRYDITRGLSFNAQASKRIVGNVDTSTRLSDSILPHVRSDIGLYQNAGDPTIDRLTADYLFKIRPDLYGRVSTGIFERMYGGVSAELLWAPTERNLAFGAELNWVKQRDFDQLLSFRDYSALTGHVSAYWDMGNGFASQLDVGRYLAKDWGATLSVDRVFDNGWKFGGYFTLTDVSFDDFGEGSFDKGIRLTVPLSWATGKPSQQKYNILIQPIYRDGGARVDIPNRLYETIRGASAQSLEQSWGRFWR